MILPDDLRMKETGHGHGAKGMAFYHYEDSQGLGVFVDSRRPDRRSRFATIYRFRWLPNQEFHAYAELQAAVATLSDDAIEAEKAKWPQTEGGIEAANGNNHCWLHTDRRATKRGSIATCWIRGCTEMALLCDQCGEAAAGDPAVIERATAQRRANVAARAGLSFLEA